MLKAIIFDWGDTVMRDFKLEGPMSTWEKVQGVPGVRGALESLAANYRCIIATSAGHSNADEMRNSLKRVGLDTYFRAYYASADTGVYKPNPDFYEVILQSEGLSDDDVIAVGNLYEKDIVPAKQAGLGTIFFNENEESGKYPLADRVITSMLQLPDTIVVMAEDSC